MIHVDPGFLTATWIYYWCKAFFVCDFETLLEVPVSCLTQQFPGWPGPALSSDYLQNKLIIFTKSCMFEINSFKPILVEIDKLCITNINKKLCFVSHYWHLIHLPREGEPVVPLIYLNISEAEEKRRKKANIRYRLNIPVIKPTYKTNMPVSRRLNVEWSVLNNECNPLPSARKSAQARKQCF